MKYMFASTLSLTALSLTLALPALAQSDMSPQQGSATQMQNQTDQATPAGTGMPHGEREAMRMVPARATLKSSLDAAKLAPGAQFRAVLESKVRLANGPELPRGTVLLGTVEADDSNLAGKSRLALRFNQAVTREGNSIPIKATIVSFFTPGTVSDSTGVEAPGAVIPNTWNDGTLQVDQIGVTHGVDLHSRIASHNSGVFIGQNDRDVRLPASSELALAIAQQTPRQQMNNSTAGQQ